MKFGEYKWIRFQDNLKTSQPIEGRSQRKIESGNASRPNKFEMNKVEFLKSFFFRVESVQQRSNIKVEVEENLNTNWVEVEARWVD
jgi:hypothetical protein